VLKMSMLSQISKPADRPVIVTILGDSGLGKTTLAASFPNPIVIRAEDGLQAIPAELRPDAFPLVQKEEEVWQQIMALLQEKHDYKTVIIDSVTALERLFVQHVIDSDSKKPRSINQALGGYGAGLQAVASLHQRVRKACGLLNERKGMHVVFVAHADTETIELPDQDPYTRYNLRLGKKSVAPYVDDSDVVGFLKLETFTTGDGDRKKAISDGTRVLVCHATASNVSKNRYGINEPLHVEQGKNPLVDFIPSLKVGA
jgi:GTPase SAR1 family protein